MAVVGLTLDETKEYICADDPGNPEGLMADEEIGAQPTVFILGALSSRVMTKLRDQSTKFNMEPGQELKANFAPNEAAWERVRMGLKGWKNFVDGQGKEIPFKTEEISVTGKPYTVVALETMDRIPLSVIQELSMAIDEFNTPTEPLGKASEE